ncbi:unnamed protein product [Plutella xylostella]|uniref:(diamondback moth) hypothetical protein n=1 Tax=Plutella xylostella TaxID=51655 RepID=A0A8S4FA21_PLUXY|nr:unnamed protein product [Plutella xylostella]
MPDELAFLSSVSQEFESTGTSAVDAAAGLLRGRPHGGVALLWNRTVFQNVSVVQCSNPRVCAIKVSVGQRSFLVFSVYAPTDKLDNLMDFTDCLSSDSDTGPGGRGITTRFTAKEVCMAIKSMSRGKSPGHDGLSIEHLQHAGPHLPRTLAMLYNLCIAHSYLPAEMLKTVVVPIVKNKTGDKCDKNNYRPISLATIVAKVLDSLLNSELDKYLNIHDNQFGFKQGLSTESAILCLKQTVKYYTSRRTPIYACFLDLSKAFDLVSYDILWQKLSEAEMPPELNNIFKCWYQSQINVVRWSNALSEPYRLECGVRQGGLTSPKLFNLYVNALIKELSETRVGCHIDNVCINNISYADDMVLLSASVCGITKLLGICERYASSHGLKYNVSKSECMVFRVGSKAPSCVPPIKLNGSPLKIVEQFKYLGHVITADLKDNADIERERRALSVRANMIARRFARCSAEVKITLFRAYCSSFYTSSLWVNHTQRAYNALRVQYNNAFRVLMGLPRFCSASGMFAAARVDCFHATMRKRCTSLVRRVRASANTILALFANRFDLQYMNHCCMIHVLERLTTTKWGASPQVLRTSGLALAFSVGEYACPVWGRSAHAKLVDTALNETCRIITGCLKPTPVQMLYPLAGIAPPDVRRTVASSAERAKMDDTRHPMHGFIPAPQRLPSRRSFMKCVYPLNTSQAQGRCALWRQKVSLPTPFVQPSENLPPGHKLPWETWKSLNRLRTQVGRSKDNMARWGFTDAQNLNCLCEAPQTMVHLTSCPACPYTCTREELMTATSGAEVPLATSAPTEAVEIVAAASTPLKKRKKIIKKQKNNDDAAGLPATLIANNEIKCRQELHAKQMKNEDLKYEVLLLEKELLKHKIEFYKSKTNK